MFLPSSRWSPLARVGRTEPSATDRGCIILRIRLLSPGWLPRNDAARRRSASSAGATRPRQGSPRRRPPVTRTRYRGPVRFTTRIPGGALLQGWGTAPDGAGAKTVIVSPRCTSGAASRQVAVSTLPRRAAGGRRPTAPTGRERLGDAGDIARRRARVILREDAAAGPALRPKPVRRRTARSRSPSQQGCRPPARAVERPRCSRHGRSLAGICYQLKFTRHGRGSFQRAR